MAMVLAGKKRLLCNREDVEHFWTRCEEFMWSQLKKVGGWMDQSGGRGRSILASQPT